VRMSLSCIIVAKPTSCAAKHAVCAYYRHWI